MCHQVYQGANIGCYLLRWKVENIQYLGENENFMSKFGHIGQLSTWHITSNISHMAPHYILEV